MQIQSDNSDVLRCCYNVWLFLSGYRAILAEPKNKSSESFEHDYYSNNTRQEPRGNTLPFCKSQLLRLQIIFSIEYSDKVRMQLGRSEANGDLGQHLNSRLDVGVRNEMPGLFLCFMAHFAVVG